MKEAEVKKKSPIQALLDRAKSLDPTIAIPALDTLAEIDIDSDEVLSVCRWFRFRIRDLEQIKEDVARIAERTEEVHSIVEETRTDHGIPSESSG